MLLAEELLLLLLDPKPGDMVASDFDLGIGSALLTELAWGGHVELGPRTKRWLGLPLGLTPVVRPTALPPPTDAALVDALGLIAAKERRPPRVVEHLGRGLYRTLLERLEAQMILRPQTDMVRDASERLYGGLPLVDRNHPGYAAHVLGVRRQLEQALVLGADADERTAALRSSSGACGPPRGC